MAERSYRQLLTDALEVGRADGRFAAAFESPVTSGVGDRCLGRTAEEFARLLWGALPGLPTGLEQNAPLWYATGYVEGLAEGAAQPRGTADRSGTHPART
jgi:hypothetical protein